VHIPLVNVSHTLGPTRVCPCTHGDFTTLDQDVFKQKRVLLKNLYVKSAGGGREYTCERFGNTHYNATSKFGDIKLYDASLFHRGLANTGSEDRPMVVLAFGASAHEVAQRQYAKQGNLKQRSPKLLARMAEEAEKFRAAFAEIF